MGYKENVRGAGSQYTQVEQEFQEEAADMDVVDSIRDVESIEIRETGPKIVREEAELAAIELHKASEIEQEVREHTGIKENPLPPHPDGHKKDGKDGRDDAFGKSYTRVRKTKPSQAPVSYIRTMPLRTPEERDVEEIEVYFACCGYYVPFLVRSDASQQEIETLGSDYFKGNFCLIDFSPRFQDFVIGSKPCSAKTEKMLPGWFANEETRRMRNGSYSGKSYRIAIL
jgi:hypothetical protein